MLVEIIGKRYEEQILTTSLKVADKFEKQHKDVLESIRGIRDAMSTAEFSALFKETSYKASNGKNNPMYEMNEEMVFLYWLWGSQEKKH